METLRSARVGHLELVLDDRDVYYIKVCSTSSGLPCWHLPPARLLWPQSHGPCFIADITIGILVVLPLLLTVTFVTSWCSEMCKEEKSGLEPHYRLGQKLIILVI